MKYYIGLDIGGTKCAVSVGEVEKNNIRILERNEVATTRNPLETLGSLDIFVREYLKKYSITRAGISCGGPLDSHRGIILNPPNLLSWENFPIVDYIQKEYNLSARLENDANACAVAEWKFGAGMGAKNMVFLTLMKMEWNFITEFMFIILPFSVLGAILFTLYEREIKEQ